MIRNRNHEPKPRMAHGDAQTANLEPSAENQKSHIDPSHFRFEKIYICYELKTPSLIEQGETNTFFTKSWFIIHLVFTAAIGAIFLRIGMMNG